MMRPAHVPLIADPAREPTAHEDEVILAYFLTYYTHVLAVNGRGP